MRIAMDVSYSDFPQTWGKSAETWGPSSVKRIIDKISDAGYQAGPLAAELLRRLQLSDPGQRGGQGLRGHRGFRGMPRRH